MATAIAAQRQSKLEVAEEYYRRAFLNARLSRLGPREKSGVLYNLALVKRDLCKLDEAETVFLESLRIAEESQASVGRLMLRILELSQLYYDQERYAEALPWMERATKLGYEMDAPSSEPGRFGEYFREYAIVLRSQGQDERAAEVDEQAAELRDAAAAAGAPLGREHPLFRHPPCDSQGDSARSSREASSLAASIR